MFYVQEKQCNQCLFGSFRIVSQDRKREIIRSCVEEDNFFICHKQQVLNLKEKDVGKLGLCCHGFFQRFKTRPIRMAKMMDLVKFVNYGDKHE